MCCPRRQNVGFHVLRGCSEIPNGEKTNKKNLGEHSQAFRRSRFTPTPTPCRGAVQFVLSSFFIVSTFSTFSVPSPFFIVSAKSAFFFVPSLFVGGSGSFVKPLFSGVLRCPVPPWVCITYAPPPWFLYGGGGTENRQEPPRHERTGANPLPCFPQFRLCVCAVGRVVSKRCPLRDLEPLPLAVVGGGVPRTPPPPNSP